MGVISRRVVPVCGHLCVCCPALRARSRHPIKRYKKLLADVFPRSQEEAPNDRKIGKLGEYAAKNPLRIPKIAHSLEQRGYKELRAEHLGSVRVIMQIFCNLLSCCRDQMPLFAVNVLNMIQTLLDQKRLDEMRVLGCRVLFSFIYSQTDGTYIRNVEGLLPNLFSLARETGEEERRCCLRAAGLQAISAIIWFMGEYSRVLCEFSEVAVVTLENYEIPSINLDGFNNWVGADNRVKEVLKSEVQPTLTAAKDTLGKFPSQKRSCYSKDHSIRAETETPKAWARICIQNMACLAKEATTVRRILEPMLQYFDAGKHWSPERGLSLAVLHEMFLVMEKSGNEHLLLAVLIKHLDHKNVSHQAQMKTDIVEVATILVRESKSMATITEVGVLNDVFWHFRRCMQSSLEALGPLEQNWNASLQSALEECLLEFVKRVADAKLIFEMMAVTLERLSATVPVARATIGALNILAHTVASLPDKTHAQQEFPETLFHQLSQALIHPDHETRFGVHQMFAMLLNPASFHANQNSNSFLSERSLTSSTIPYASAAAMFEKIKRENIIFQGDCNGTDRHEDLQSSSIELTTLKDEVNKKNVKESNPDIRTLGCGKIRGSLLSFSRTLVSSINASSNSKGIERGVVRLNGEQATILFSALWIEANLPDNVPANFEVMSHTYCLTLFFSGPKVSNHNILTHAFRLAFSMRKLALIPSGFLPPSRRRSLFTLGTVMITFVAIIFNIPEIVDAAKSSLLGHAVDPFLEPVDDYVLKVSDQTDIQGYGTPADDALAEEYLSRLATNENSSNEALALLVVNSLTDSSEVDKSSMHQEILQFFSVDDIFTFHPQLQLETVYPYTTTDSKDALSPEEALESNTLVEDDIISDTSGTDLPWPMAKTPIPTPSRHVISINQLLESALEAAGQVASVSISATPLSYCAMASQCEAFGANTRGKFSTWMQVGTAKKSLLMSLCADEKLDQVFKKETHDPANARSTSMSVNPLFMIKGQDSWQTLRLPPASPYDNFMKAAGR